MRNGAPPARWGGVCILCLLGISVLLYSCGNDRQRRANVKPLSAVVTHVVSGTGGDSALLEGILVSLHDCIVVRTSSGLAVPAFPRGSVKVAPTGITYLSHHTSYNAKISLGGGFATSHTNLAIPAQCRGQAPIFIVAQE